MKVSNRCHMYWNSGGSDNTLNLWRVASCSSAPWIGAEDSAEGEDTDPPDVKVYSTIQSVDVLWTAANTILSTAYVKCISLRNLCYRLSISMFNSSLRYSLQVRVIDQHEDSIYSVAWSPADAWMYCSLSYDGTYVKFSELPLLILSSAVWNFLVEDHR